jgi:hypothetical protein
MAGFEVITEADVRSPSASRTISVPSTAYSAVGFVIVARIHISLDLVALGWSQQAELAGLHYECAFPQDLHTPRYFVQKFSMTTRPCFLLSNKTPSPFAPRRATRCAEPRPD